MQDAPEFQLGILDAAIAQVNDSDTPLMEKRAYLLSCLRITRAHFTHKRLWWEHWELCKLVRLVEEHDSVNGARRALQARIGATPITNRGVTFEEGVQGTENHVN